MKLIAGLGNPGKKYESTRHNIGFRVVEVLAKRHKASLKRKIFYRANEARCNFLGEDLVLVEPLTFMNLSGGSILHYLKKLNLQPENLIVICDDINLSLGRVRIRPLGSAGGHNGLSSIIKSLRREDFTRIRLGVGARNAECDLADYVLSNFKKEESPAVEEAIHKAADACECWIRDGIDKAMSVFNG